MKSKSAVKTKSNLVKRLVANGGSSAARDFAIDETDQFSAAITTCRRCPRVLKHCLAVADKKIMRRAVFADQTYWGKPVPNFGRLPAKLLIVGLAPGAHGSNRTSRMFTGDDSGLWLYRAMHRAGFSETANCTSVGDNRLIDCSVTSVTHCAPPGNKPAPLEIKNCEPFLIDTVKAAEAKVILALGGIAWDRSLLAIEKVYGVNFGRGMIRPKFAHGQRLTVHPLNSHAEMESIELIASYHVSRQNTNTGRLTEKMLDDVFETARELVNATRAK